MIRACNTKTLPLFSGAYVCAAATHYHKSMLQFKVVHMNKDLTLPDFQIKALTNTILIS